MPCGWLQRCNYSCELVELQCYGDFLRLWQSLDIEKMDADLRDAVNNGCDCCSWGIGINQDNKGCSLHIYRQDPNSSCFVLLKRQIHTRRLLGFIPYKRRVSSYNCVDSPELLLREVEAYYRQIGRA